MLQPSKRSARSFVSGNPAPDPSRSRSSTPDPTSLAEAPPPLRRSPLAPIDQRALAPTPDHMSSPSSPSSSMTHDSSQTMNTQSLAKPRRASHTSEEAYLLGNSSCPSPRKKSLSHMANSSRPSPYPPTKPTRRPSHAHSHSASSISSQRTSLPSIHLQAPTTPATVLASNPSPQNMQQNEENISAEEFQQTYAALSTYTFGAATTSTRSQDTDMLSPLASPGGNDNDGRSSNPAGRRSISHPRNEDEDDEAAARRDRAKMRAVDDGGRRPSLPSNLPSTPAPLTGADIDPSHPSASSRSQHPADDAGDATDVSDADPQDSGALDTDVEVEDTRADTVSQHTFGVGLGRTHSQRTATRLVWNNSDSDAESEAGRDWETYTVDPSDRRAATTSPVTFARTLLSDEESLSSEHGQSISVSYTSTGRRGSLPLAIPGRTPPSSSFEGGLGAGDAARDREGSVATLRRPSRSLDDDLRAINAGMSGMGTSEPTTRADWHALEEEHAAMQASASSNPYDGVDLDYIFSGASGSRRSSSSFMQPLPAPPIQEKGKGKASSKGSKGREKERPNLRDNVAEFFGGYIEPGPSTAGLASAMAEIAPWETPENLTQRRPSTITLGEDTFTGHLRRYDPQGDQKMSEWVFRKVGTSADTPSQTHHSSGMRSTQHNLETWTCQQIGKLRVERLTLASANPAKPPQQRLRVRHERDPLCRANDRGGPETVVHKHSKAVAFSIFRGYGLLAPRSRSAGNRAVHNAVLDPSSSILLAPKHVQPEYTNTQSTRLLSTHGLLEHGNAPEQRQGRLPRDRSSAPKRTAPDVPSLPPTPPAPANPLPYLERRIADQNAIAQAMRPSTSGSVTESFLTATVTTGSAQSSLDLARSAESTTSHGTAGFVVPEPPVAGPSRQDNDSDSDSDEFPRHPQRTSHAEAFATLDHVALEQYRARQPSPTVSPSVSNWFRRRVRAPTTSRSTQSNINPVNPPWIMLSSRTHQDRNNRTLSDLNQSFKEVGLLPAYKRRGSSGIGRTGQITGGEVLTQVPDDSPYMLLPLYPHETDSESAAAAEGGQEPHEPDVHNRLYLLVYYIPFDEQKTHGSGASKKQRSRSESGRGEPASRTEHAKKSIYLRSFRAIARLVAYSDLKGSGVRLPTRGLSVTGPMDAAVRGIPPAALRDVHHDDFVIAMCFKRERGVQMVPDGLEKLGLCEPRPEAQARPPVAAGMQVEDLPEEEKADPQPLTALGRAAVEMAWLGCMAVMDFAGY